MEAEPVAGPSWQPAQQSRRSPSAGAQQPAQKRSKLRMTPVDSVEHTWRVEQINVGLAELCEGFIPGVHHDLPKAEKSVMEKTPEQVLMFIARVQPLLGSLLCYPAMANWLNKNLHDGYPEIDRILLAISHYPRQGPPIPTPTRRLVHKAVEECLSVRMQLEYARGSSEIDTRKVHPPSKRHFDLETEEGMREYRRKYPWMTDDVASATRLAQQLKLPAMFVRECPAADAPENMYLDGAKDARRVVIKIEDVVAPPMPTAQESLALKDSDEE